MDLTENTVPLLLFTCRCLVMTLPTCLFRSRCLATGLHATIRTRCHMFVCLFVCLLLCSWFTTRHSVSSSGYIVSSDNYKECRYPNIILHGLMENGLVTDVWTRDFTNTEQWWWLLVVHFRWCYPCPRPWHIPGSMCSSVQRVNVILPCKS
jgi:hypothetical protein